MNDAERDRFLAERRVGVIGIGGEGAGPLLAPIWYEYQTDKRAFSCMGGSSAKAHLLRSQGRATLCVQAEDFPYRYVAAEGPIRAEPLGDGTFEAIRAVATRYLGADAGLRYAQQFSTPDEIVVTLSPDRWRSDIPGPARPVSDASTDPTLPAGDEPWPT